MDKIKVITETKRLYQCKTCKTAYANLKDAKKCAAKKPEKKVFKKGDYVVARERRECTYHCKTKRYVCRGIITRILGPYAPDDEYEKKWLGAKPERLASHVYMYLVGYICPVCRKEESHVFYAPELTLVPTKETA